MRKPAEPTFTQFEVEQLALYVRNPISIDDDPELLKTLNRLDADYLHSLIRLRNKV